MIEAVFLKQKWCGVVLPATQFSVLIHFIFFRFLVKLFHNKNETKSKFLFLIPRRGRRRYGLECSVLVQQLVVVEIANIYPTSRIPCSARRCLPPLEPWGSGLRSARPRQCRRRRARGLPHQPH